VRSGGPARSSWLEREEDLENELNRGALWAITYGDVMSYLMIFFLMMFAFTYSRGMQAQLSAMAIEGKFGGKAGIVVEEIFSKRGIQMIARIQVSDERIRLSFLEPVLFDEAKAELKESSTPHLAKLAEALKDIPNAVQIEGHTDNVPLGPHAEFHSNWELSAARAFSVLRFLIQIGIPPERLSALGYGEYMPVAPNNTPEGRSLNRRIEINILRRKA